MQTLANKNILLIISGGIAAYKSLELIRLMKTQGANIRTILTHGGSQFITPLSVSALTGEKTYTDLWNLNDESEMGHIRLSRECDLIVIAPASADLMAKMAHGLANDLASTTLLASDKPIMICPAMNPMMWQNRATQDNVATLKSRGMIFCGPAAGDMACGETGAGRLMEPADILHDINAHFNTSQSAITAKPLRGKKAIVTSGPTHEPIDPVRFIGNYSSGKQGHAIACALRDAGADVTLISGPTSLPAPNGMSVINVKTAQDMLGSVENALPADIAICAAAVADWRHKDIVDEKIKKTDDQDEISVRLVKNPDILKMLGHLPQNTRPQIVIGFAAETHNLLDNARAKLTRKKADMIIANAVNSCDSVFGADDNHVYVVQHNDITEWPKAGKSDIARKIVAQLSNMLDQQGSKNTADAAE